jgi:hypothetical protein
LGWWLCKEYQFRYGETKVHKTEAHVVWLLNNHPALPFRKMTPIKQAMPEEYKQQDPVLAYRTYYVEDKHKKRNIIKYTKRETPDFILQNVRV